MKNKINVLLLFAFLFSIGRIFCQDKNNSDRYINESYFSKRHIKSDTAIVYGYAKDWKNNIDTQKLNVFYPKLKQDSLKHRPFVLLLHGGGFHTEDDFSQKKQWNKVCTMLAERGFVSATIDYRVGWDDKDKVWNPRGKVIPSGVFATYRAYQDARAALRYFVHNAEDYGIDTNNIFIGGRSAGGDISLATAFLTQQNLDSLIATVIPDNCHKLLGSIDSSTNDLTDKYKIRGVLNMWGPIPDTSFISKEEALTIPILMFHGTNDSSVPYKRFAPPQYPYNRDGSFNIALRYKHLGGCYELNTKLGGGHGEDFSNEFLTEHISFFIKNVMAGTCKSAEYESSISFNTKLSQYFTSGTFVSILVFILVVFFIIKKVKDKKHYL